MRRLTVQRATTTEVAASRETAAIVLPVPDRKLLCGPTDEAALFVGDRQTTSASSRSVAQTCAALDGLGRALRAPKLHAWPRGRCIAATNALEQVGKYTKPGQSGADRDALAGSLEALRSALLGLKLQSSSPALEALSEAIAPAGGFIPPTAALDAFVNAFNARAYDLGLEPLGLVSQGGTARFVSHLEQLSSVPAGISAMPGAPVAPLADGSQMVPAQYRQFRLTEQDAQQIVAQIELPPGLVAFVGQEPSDGGLYVQIGVLGPDNYGRRDQNPDKLVYGRRWRIEPALPDYELVQTVFAAARDALDHETRELFSIDGRTPFSGHIDVVSLAAMLKTGTVSAPQNPELTSPQDVQILLERTRFAGQKLRVLETEHRARTGTLAVVFELVPQTSSRPLPGFDGKVFEARAEGTRASDVLHAINEEFRRASLRHLEERFRFDGVPRFSREIHPELLGEISFRTRSPAVLQGEAVSAEGRAFNAAVESDRAPTVAPGPATELAEAKIRAQAPLLGNPPRRSVT